MNDKNDFTEGPILKKLVLFMLPILLALVLQAMYGAVDVLMIGHFGTSAGISGVSTGSSVLTFITFVIAGLATGVTVAIGKHLGEKKNELIGSVIGGTICLFAVIAAILTVVMLVFAPQLTAMMRAPEEAVEQTIKYVRICGGGIFFIIAYNILSCIFRGLGDSKMPLVFVGIACVVNIIGDFVFVAILHMDVAGAALATVIAQAVSVLLSLIIIKNRTLPFTLKRSDIRFNSEIRGVLKVGIPLGVQEIMTQVSFLALCAFVNNIGLEASSGYGVATKIITFIMLIPGSLVQSLSAFISQNVGAKREDRARKTLGISIIMGLCIGFFVLIIVYFKGDLISSIFTSNQSYIAQSWAYLRGFCTESFLCIILFSFIGYFNGHGQSLFVLFQGMAQTFIVRLPFAYYMSTRPEPNLTKIGFAAPLATIFGIVINLSFFLVCIKKQKSI